MRSLNLLFNILGIFLDPDPHWAKILDPDPDLPSLYRIWFHHTGWNSSSVPCLQQCFGSRRLKSLENIQVHNSLGEHRTGNIKVRILL